MSGRVLRWQVPVDDADHELPVAGPVVHTEAAAVDLVEFWAFAGDGEQVVPRVFRVFGTGDPVPGGYVWRGTTARKHGLVWHLMERR